MKLRQLLLGVLFCAASASAQDVITKTDGTKLDAKVEEITETTVRYRQFSRPNGPIYSLQLSSIANIRYNDGTIENFSKAATAAKVAPAVDDAALLRMSGNLNKNIITPQQLYSKAKTYRLVGWIGGGVLLAGGIFLSYYFASDGFYNTDDDFDSADFIAGIPISAVAGAAWCLGFNLKANSFVKQARQMETYSATIFEDEVLRVGNSSLMAGVNLMNNKMAHSQGLGLSLKLNF